MSQSLVEQYKTATTRRVKAPSGFSFTVRGLTPQETLVALRGLPTLAPPKDPENLTDEEINARSARTTFANKASLMAAVDEIGEGEDKFPYEILTAGDIMFLLEEINIASGLVSEEASLARAMFRGPGVQAVPSA